MPELLARVHVGEVHLHHRDADRGDRVPDGDAVVGVGARVEHHAVVFGARRVEPVDDGALVVGLEHVARKALRLGVRHDLPVDVVDPLGPVDARLPHAHQVEVRSVDDQNLFHDCPPFAVRYIRFIVPASSACVPADSQMKVGVPFFFATSSASGSKSGPNSVSSKVRWTFSPPGTV